MNLSDLIERLVAIEQRHIGHMVKVEIRDEAGVLTSDIQLTEDIVFGPRGSRTVRLEVKDEQPKRGEP